MFTCVFAEFSVMAVSECAVSSAALLVANASVKVPHNKIRFVFLIIFSLRQRKPDQMIAHLRDIGGYLTLASRLVFLLVSMIP